MQQIRPRSPRTIGLCLAIMMGVGTLPARAEEEARTTLWESSAALGLSLARGNTRTLMFNANAQTQRIVDPDELRFELDAIYGKTDGRKSAEILRGAGQYNRLFTERLYAGLRLDALRDVIADVDYRFTLSPMAGYYFVKRERTTLAGEFGPAFIYERLGGRERGYAALRLGERFEHKFTEKSRVWQSLEFLPQVDDFDNFLLQAEVGAESALTGNLNIRVTLQNWYDNQPAPGRKKNDVRLMSALVYAF